MAKVPFEDLLVRAGRWIRSGEAAKAARRLAPAAIFLAALVVRLRFVADHPPGLYVVSDMEFYDRRADHLLAGQGTIWDTFTPLGYPALLALIYAVAGKSHDAVGVVQAFLGAGTCVLAWALARRLTRSDLAAAAAGVVLAFYTPLVVYTGFLLTETLFSFLLALAALLLVRAGDGGARSAPALAGLALGAATVVRPNLLFAFPFLAACAWVRPAASGSRRAPLVALAFAAPLLAVVVAYNTRLAGRPSGLASNGGLNFYLGHCGCRKVRFPAGQAIRESSGYHNRKRYTEPVDASEPAYAEAHFYREGLRLLADRPSRLLRDLANVSDGLALGDLGPLPAQPYWPGWMGHEEELRLFARAALWLGWVPALAGTVWLARRRRLLAPEEAPRRVLLALVASVPPTLYLFLGDPRLRVVFDPLVIALSADAWLAAARAIRRSQPPA